MLCELGVSGGSQTLTLCAVLRSVRGDDRTWVIELGHTFALSARTAALSRSRLGRPRSPLGRPRVRALRSDGRAFALSARSAPSQATMLSSGKKEAQRSRLSVLRSTSSPTSRSKGQHQSTWLPLPRPWTSTTPSTRLLSAHSTTRAAMASAVDSRQASRHGTHSAATSMPLPTDPSDLVMG